MVVKPQCYLFFHAGIWLEQIALSILFDKGSFLVYEAYVKVSLSFRNSIWGRGPCGGLDWPRQGFGDKGAELRRIIELCGG